MRARAVRIAREQRQKRDKTRFQCGGECVKTEYPQCGSGVLFADGVDGKAPKRVKSQDID